MATLNVGGREFDTDALSAEAKQQIANIRVVDQEIARLQIQLGIAQTARGAYASALRALLPEGTESKALSPLERAMAAGEYLNLG